MFLTENIIAHNFDYSVAFNISTLSYSIGNNAFLFHQETFLFGRTAHVMGTLGKIKVNIFYVYIFKISTVLNLFMFTDLSSSLPIKFLVIEFTGKK